MDTARPLTLLGWKHETEFWDKTIPEPNTGCWLWMGYYNDWGYGRWFKDGEQHRTHRIAYALTHGTVPSDKVVCHRCDNPPCCNPAHLFLGTHDDNRADMRRKGRAQWQQVGWTDRLPRGAARPGARLNDDTVRSIRRRAASGESFVDIAASLDVSRTTILKVVHRVTWKHVA